MHISPFLAVTLDDAYKISQIIGAFGSIIAGFVTLAILCITYRLTRSAKRAEILAHCNSRFEEVLRLSHETATMSNPMIYYRRYWALQFDQFTYWLHGFVGDDVFLYWMRERHEAWISNTSIGSMDYQTGWKQAMACWTYCDFVDFMNIVHEHTVEEAMCKYGKAGHWFFFQKPRLLK